MPPMGGTSGSSARPSFPSGPSTRAAAFSAAVVRDGASDSRCSTANSKGKSENEFEMFSKSVVNARVNPSLRAATAGEPARTGILDARTKAAFSLGANAGLHARGRSTVARMRSRPPRTASVRPPRRGFHFHGALAAVRRSNSAVTARRAVGRLRFPDFRSRDFGR